MIMGWRDCVKDPPQEYYRVEIRDKQNKRYIGYRYGRKYFETYGNYLIKEPTYWREPPKGSKLISELQEKLRINVGGDVAYGATSE